MTAPAPLDPLAGLTTEQRTDMEAAARNWSDGSTDELAPRRALRAAAVDALRAVASKEGASKPSPYLRGALAGLPLTDPEVIAASDRLYAETDCAEAEARQQLQSANRHAAYLKARPSKHAKASYDMLRPQQNPRGLVSAWWDRGPRVLVLAGSSRTGKSTAAYAICNHAHSERAWVVSITAVALNEACRPADRDRDVPASQHVPSRRDPDAFQRAAMCDLLLLDDLGRENVSDWWRSQVQELLDIRDREQRRSIVTANTSTDPGLAYNELLDRYDDPVVERLFDGGGIVMFDGPPIRNLVTDW
ncbi:ATP-binding protein [Micromonospora sp. DT227]|uniref:ATP-binding protein n=1 Tax=Micromonospora sp. DT227 TaxID=3393433 RepID=UPI003CFB1135